jgi:hypothetical protein
MRKKIISAVGEEFIINNLSKEYFETTGDIFEQEVLFDLLKNDFFDKINDSCERDRKGCEAEP